MKHPCGKEFDYNQSLKIRDDKIKLVESFKSSTKTFDHECIIVFCRQYNGTIDYHLYQECGHWRSNHVDDDYDLINVTEIKEEKKEIDTVLICAYLSSIVGHLYNIKSEINDIKKFNSIFCMILDNVTNIRRELEKLND
jgi:hypothetical protein